MVPATILSHPAIAGVAMHESPQQRSVFVAYFASSVAACEAGIGAAKCRTEVIAAQHGRDCDCNANDLYSAALDP